MVFFHLDIDLWCHFFTYKLGLMQFVDMIFLLFMHVILFDGNDNSLKTKFMDSMKLIKYINTILVVI